MDLNEGKLFAGPLSAEIIWPLAGGSFQLFSWNFHGFSDTAVLADHPQSAVEFVQFHFL